MPGRSAQVFACPHCTSPLVRFDGTARCGNNHSFDVAREGYVNLLVGGRLPSSATPGDTPGSLAARRRFLSSGAYAPIADAVAAALGDVDGPVLDVGCGEGWYLTHISADAKFGIDISKKAVQMACRQLPGAEFAVASAHRLPVLDGACAAVFSVFSPHSIEEFRRVLQPGGTWVTATPGADHLREMRPEHGNDSRAAGRFDRRNEPPAGSASTERVRFSLHLGPETSQDLLAMTPLRWQAGARDVNSVTVDVWVSSGSRRD